MASYTTSSSKSRLPAPFAAQTSDPLEQELANGLILNARNLGNWLGTLVRKTSLAFDEDYERVAGELSGITSGEANMADSDEYTHLCSKIKDVTDTVPALVERSLNNSSVIQAETNTMVGSVLDQLGYLEEAFRFASVVKYPDQIELSDALGPAGRADTKFKAFKEGYVAGSNVGSKGSWRNKLVGAIHRVRNPQQPQKRHRQSVTTPSAPTVDDQDEVTELDVTSGNARTSSNYEDFMATYTPQEALTKHFYNRGADIGREGKETYEFPESTRALREEMKADCAALHTAGAKDDCQRCKSMSQMTSELACTFVEQCSILESTSPLNLFVDGAPAIRACAEQLCSVTDAHNRRRHHALDRALEMILSHDFSESIGTGSV